MDNILKATNNLDSYKESVLTDIGVIEKGNRIELNMVAVQNHLENRDMVSFYK